MISLYRTLPTQFLVIVYLTNRNCVYLKNLVMPNSRLPKQSGGQVFRHLFLGKMLTFVSMTYLLVCKVNTHPIFPLPFEQYSTKLSFALPYE
jgi:hypothetical protein